MQTKYSSRVTVVGGGLAGSEAAWQCARNKIQVLLYEMRPTKQTGAHVTDKLAELVCSNSLGSKQDDNASGILIRELRALDSLLLHCAEATALPAGNALAVDREKFSSLVTNHIYENPYIEVIRAEAPEIPQGIVVIASGPLTSPKLAANISALIGDDLLFFFDAIAPIIKADTIDFSIAFRASRHNKNKTNETVPGDYINCPLNKDEYDHFVNLLNSAKRIELRSFEREVNTGVKAGAGHFFEGCLPIEVLANRGNLSLAYGPMRPVGLTNPHTGERPYAVVQLRQDDLNATLYNMVGFQTNLTHSEQKRIFREIPGLGHAEFSRFGQMHRNTYLASPNVLTPTLHYAGIPSLFFAGQIAGIEGYLGNIATGLLAGLNASRLSKGQSLISLPITTMTGALCHAITHSEPTHFQPVKATMGILPNLELPHRLKHCDRSHLLSKRAKKDMEEFIHDNVI